MSGRRVLVVDDNDDSATMLTALFEVMGHDARVSLDGASALEAAAVFLPELVFLDLSLPDMDGFEVARRLRAIAGMERAVLIAVTGWSDPEMAARARAEGFAHFLVKPLDPTKAAELLSGAPR